eukprot:GGOE01011038.1.p3 GENE.GGOE01011038.1~~GGOE01011038.1.p3  ORF type:complete len:131 (-),score=7.74 GGOE01011038.1:1880-2272(-)
MASNATASTKTMGRDSLLSFLSFLHAIGGIPAPHWPQCFFIRAGLMGRGNQCRQGGSHRVDGKCGSERELVGTRMLDPNVASSVHSWESDCGGHLEAEAVAMDTNLTCLGRRYIHPDGAWVSHDPPNPEK